MTRRMTAAEYRELLFLDMPEGRFVSWVVDVAQSAGWKVTHFRPARTADGSWVTAIEGDRGYPDLTLARRGSATHIWEAKSQRGRLDPDQIEWLEAMTDVEWSPTASGILWPTGSGISVGVIRPAMRDEILAELGAEWKLPR